MACCAPSCTASGLLQTAQQLGGTIGLAVIASVYAAGAVPGEFMPGLTAAFLASTAMSLTALVVAVVALRTRRRTHVEMAVAARPGASYARR